MTDDHGTPRTDRLRSAGAIIECECGERLELGHPANGPYVCTNCRRWWTIDVSVTWEHEHDRNPRAAMYDFAMALYHIQNGRPVDEAIAGAGAEAALRAMIDEGRLLPPLPKEDD